MRETRDPMHAGWAMGLNGPEWMQSRESIRSRVTDDLSEARGQYAYVAGELREIAEGMEWSGRADGPADCGLYGLVHSAVELAEHLFGLLEPRMTAFEFEHLFGLYNEADDADPPPARLPHDERGLLKTLQAVVPASEKLEVILVEMRAELRKRLPSAPKTPLEKYWNDFSVSIDVVFASVHEMRAAIDLFWAALQLACRLDDEQVHDGVSESEQQQHEPGASKTDSGDSASDMAGAAAGDPPCPSPGTGATPAGA